MTLMEPTPGHKLKSESRPPYEVVNSERRTDEEVMARALQVPAELEKLFGDLEKAEALVDQLVQRLEHVLRVRDDGGGVKDENLVNLCPLASGIRNQRLLFRKGVLEKLDYILNSLEI